LARFARGIARSMIRSTAGRTQGAVLVMSEAVQPRSAERVGDPIGRVFAPATPPAVRLPSDQPGCARGIHVVADSQVVLSAAMCRSSEA